MVEIEIDRTTLPGRPCGGLVRWVPDKDCTPSKIVVTVGWQTEGRGDVDKGDLLRGEYQTGPVVGGQTVEIPFTATLPESAPRSFDAALIRLLYRAHVRVDLPWAFDETAEVVFHVGEGDPAVPFFTAGDGSDDGLPDALR
ncbi:MAG: hypothetical protein AAF532_04435 [Planctomycetota bacterium]